MTPTSSPRPQISPSEAETGKAYLLGQLDERRAVSRYLAVRAARALARRAAATDLLDRGWGKPTQPIAGDPDMPPVNWADAPDAVLAWMASQSLPDDNVTEH